MRVSTLLIATLFILTLPTLAPAATIHVPDDRPTIQAGIDAASPGDTVLIAPGTYTGTGNRDVSFGGKNLVVRSEIGADDTVIDCEGTESDPHRGFFFKSGETSSSVVEGLTIRGGYAPLDTFQLEILRAGGAIACTEESSPTIKDCTFASNYAASWGGALFTAFHSSITILRSSFFNNTARNGGVIFGFRHGGFSATDCNFEGNSAVQSGGCIDYVGGGDSRR